MLKADIPLLFLQDRGCPRPSVPALPPSMSCTEGSDCSWGQGGDKVERRPSAPGGLARIVPRRERYQRRSEAASQSLRSPGSGFLSPTGGAARPSPARVAGSGSCGAVRLSVRPSVLQSQRQLGLTSLNPASRNQFS